MNQGHQLSHALSLFMSPPSLFNIRYYQASIYQQPFFQDFHLFLIKLAL